MYTEACAERQRGAPIWKIRRFEKGETDIGRDWSKVKREKRKSEAAESSEEVDFGETSTRRQGQRRQWEKELAMAECQYEAEAR